MKRELNPRTERCLQHERVKTAAISTIEVTRDWTNEVTCTVSNTVCFKSEAEGGSVTFEFGAIVEAVIRVSFLFPIYLARTKETLQAG